MRGGVRQAQVEHGQLGAVLLGLHDPLGVRVEVVAGLQVRGQQHDRLRVRVVRRRPVVAHPVRVARATARRADVGVAVVPVDPPRLEHPLDEPVLAGTPDVVHHLVATALDDRLADPAGDVGERLVPADPLELARSALAHPAERVQDPLGVVDLVDRGRPLGAVAPTRARVRRVALELLDREVLVVDVGQQPARRLAVEADRRDQRVGVRHLARVRLGVVRDVVVPLLDRRVVAQRLVAALARHVHGRVHGCSVRGHERGGSWPARTKTLS